jgi:phosphomevalonate kinase
MKIIGLSGKMGCGKNYIAEKILYSHYKDKYNILIIGFGDLVKAELYARDKTLSYDELYDKKTFESRKKLQEYATENGRNKYGFDMWIRGLDIQIETFNKRHENALIIICDVRFKNECEYIKSKGGTIIRIISNNRTLDRYKQEGNNEIEKINNIKNHSSETELDNYNFDHIIYNDYKDDIS